MGCRGVGCGVSEGGDGVKKVTGMNVVGREKGLADSSSRGQGGSVARRTWRMAAATGTKVPKWYSTMQITDEAHCVIRDDTQH